MTQLPGILAEIEEVAGHDAALALMEAKGGLTVWIPAADEPAVWLVTIVGAEAARKIVEHFRVHPDREGNRAVGVRITIPLGTGAHHRRIRRQLAEALQSGLSPEQAARAAGVHERTAYRMQRLLRDRRNSTQLDLF